MGRFLTGKRLLKLRLCGRIGAASFGLFLMACLFSALKPGVSAPVSDGEWQGLFAVSRFTFFQALLSTVLSALFGVPLGLFLGRPGRLSQRLAAWGEAAGQLPAVIPTIAVVPVLVAWGGTEGWLTPVLRGLGFGEVGLLYRPSAVILAHFLLNAPWLAAVALQARRRLPREWEEMAEVLGASPFERWTTCLWPALRDTLGASVFQVYLWCVMSFALVLLLGGGPPVETLETVIFSKLRMGTLDVAGASRAATLQLALMLPVWFWIRSRTDQRLSRSFEIPFRDEDGSLNYPDLASDSNLFRRQRHARRVAEVLAFFLGTSLLFWLLPFLKPLTDGLRQEFAAAGSERAQGLALGSFARALFQSAKVSGLSVLVALGLSACGVLSSRSSRSPRLWRALAELPAAFSSLVLGLGFWSLIAVWWDPFSGSALFPGVLMGVLAVPWFFRQMEPHADQFPRAHWEMARTLGASRTQAFLELEWPRWRFFILGIGTQAFAMGLGEVSLVSLFAGEEGRTLALELSRALARYEFERAARWSGLLVLCVIGLLGIAALLRRQSKRGIEGRQGIR
jgi:thiamine transport system permease protein